MIIIFKLWRLLEKRGYQRKNIIRLVGDQRIDLPETPGK